MVNITGDLFGSKYNNCKLQLHNYLLKKQYDFNPDQQTELDIESIYIITQWYDPRLVIGWLRVRLVAAQRSGIYCYRYRAS